MTGQDLSRMRIAAQCGECTLVLPELSLRLQCLLTDPICFVSKLTIAEVIPFRLEQQNSEQLTRHN